MFYGFTPTLSVAFQSACLILSSLWCFALCPAGQISTRQAHVDLTPQETHTWKPSCQNPCQGTSSSSPDSSLSVHRWLKHRLWVGCIGNVTPSRPLPFSFISIFLSPCFFSSLSFHVLWFLPLFFIQPQSLFCAFICLWPCASGNVRFLSRGEGH